MTQSTYGSNFTGAVDFGLTLNGIDWKDFKGGFYYYIQPIVTDIFPQSGPSRGNSKVKVYGEGFRDDFSGKNLGCRVGNSYGEAAYVSSSEVNCIFKRLPLLEQNTTLNFSFAMNNYSFTPENENFNFTPYGIISINPSSGPIEGGTRIEIKGAGFFDSLKIRCRFGVPGWYSYTEAQYLDYNRILCSAPTSFNIPNAGQLPFSVPFSIAFNQDEFSK